MPFYLLKTHFDKKILLSGHHCWEQSIFLTFAVVFFFFFALCDDTNLTGLYIWTLLSTSYNVAVVRGMDTNDALWTNLINR